MGIMVTRYGYSNGYNNPMYHAHKNMGVHVHRSALHMAKYRGFLTCFVPIHPRAQKVIQTPS